MKKWENIKSAAAEQFQQAIARLDPRHGGPSLTVVERPAVEAVLSALLEMSPDAAETARAYAARGWSVGEALLIGFCDRALEVGLRRIDRWDVRAADRLIDLFPEIAPTYAGHAIVAREVDTPDGEDTEWVIEKAQAHRVSMGM